MERVVMGIQGITHDLPIEDAWTALADGLHVHRWFLHIAPALDATDRRQRPPGREGTAKRIPLCGTEVMFRTEGTDRVAPALVSQAGQLIEHAELGYLVRLGLSTVIVSGRPMLVAPRVVRIEPAGSPLELAARLLTAAAAQWLRLFALLGTSSRGPAHGLTRWDHAETDIAEDGLGLAVRIRLYEAVLAKPDLPTSMAIGTSEVRTELAAMHVEAEAIRPEVYQAAESLRLIAQDLLITQFPGPKRFAKYQDGGGPGQG
jgi:hypothetical protein